MNISSGYFNLLDTGSSGHDKTQRRRNQGFPMAASRGAQVLTLIPDTTSVLQIFRQSPVCSIILDFIYIGTILLENQ